MSDTNIISNYLQGIFWANLGVNMFNTIVSEKELDTAKDAAERGLNDNGDENAQQEAQNAVPGQLFQQVLHIHVAQAAGVRQHHILGIGPLQVVDGGIEGWAKTPSSTKTGWSCPERSYKGGPRL